MNYEGCNIGKYQYAVQPESQPYLFGNSRETSLRICLINAALVYDLPVLSTPQYAISI